jgi:hypothetical protein
MPNQPTSPLVSIDFAFSEGGALTGLIENSTFAVESSEDRLAFTRYFDITRDKKGLATARVLADVLALAISRMEFDLASGTLPDALQIIKPTLKSNPFN